MTQLLRGALCGNLHQSPLEWHQSPLECKLQAVSVGNWCVVPLVEIWCSSNCHPPLTFAPVKDQKIPDKLWPLHSFKMWQRLRKMKMTRTMIKSCVTCPLAASKLMPHESCLTQKGTVAHVDQFFLFFCSLATASSYVQSLKKCPSTEWQAMLFEYSRSENRLAKKSAIQQFGINQFEGWLSAASRWNIIASQLSFVLPKACPPAVRCHSSSKRDIKVFVIFILRLHHIMAAHCFKGNQKFISHLLVHAVPTPVTYGSGDREDILIFGERKWECRQSFALSFMLASKQLTTSDPVIPMIAFHAKIHRRLSKLWEDLSRGQAWLKPIQLIHIISIYIYTHTGNNIKKHQTWTMISQFAVQVIHKPTGEALLVPFRRIHLTDEDRVQGQPDFTICSRAKWSPDFSIKCKRIESKATVQWFYGLQFLCLCRIQAVTIWMCMTPLVL